MRRTHLHVKGRAFINSGALSRHRLARHDAGLRVDDGRLRLEVLRVAGQAFADGLDD